MFKLSAAGTPTGKPQRQSNRVDTTRARCTYLFIASSSLTRSSLLTCCVYTHPVENVGAEACGNKRKRDAEEVAQEPALVQARPKKGKKVQAAGGGELYGSVTYVKCFTDHYNVVAF